MRVVHVGDRVTFLFMDDPNRKRSVIVSNGPSDPDNEVINRLKPLAAALLNHAENEEVGMPLENSLSRQIRILKIEDAGMPSH